MKKKSRRRGRPTAAIDVRAASRFRGDLSDEGERRVVQANAKQVVTGRIYWVGGSKGGVGKSMMTAATVDYLLERGEMVGSRLVALWVINRQRDNLEASSAALGLRGSDHESATPTPVAFDGPGGLLARQPPIPEPHCAGPDGRFRRVFPASATTIDATCMQTFRFFA
jgi:hypothetical protein